MKDFFLPDVFFHVFSYLCVHVFLSVNLLFSLSLRDIILVPVKTLT